MTDEPIVTDEAEAIDRLAAIADAFLVHDRPIVRPVDDSVVRVVCGRELVLRRSRGYAPAPIAVDRMPAGILALGGHLKTTVALTSPGGAVLSQHIGDLETVAAREAHTRIIADTTQLHAAKPTSSCATCIPTTPRAARQKSLDCRSSPYSITSPMWPPAWPSTGSRRRRLASPGTAPAMARMARSGAASSCWSTESGWRRVAHLRPFRLPGGEAAAREPRRAALGLLYGAFGDEAFAMIDLPPLAAFSSAERTVLHSMLARGVNAPITSSAGRLFDAFAASAGCASRRAMKDRRRPSWNGRPRVARPGVARNLPPVGTRWTLVIDWQPALEAALGELQRGTAVGTVSEALHNGLAAAIVEVAIRIGQGRVILTGGCFQNARLTEATVAALRDAGLTPYGTSACRPTTAGSRLVKPSGRLGPNSGARHVPSGSRKGPERFQRRSDYADWSGRLRRNCQRDQSRLRARSEDRRLRARPRRLRPHQIDPEEARRRSRARRDGGALEAVS